MPEYDGVSPRINMGQDSPYAHNYKFGGQPGIAGHALRGVKCMSRYCEECKSVECPACNAEGFFTDSEHDPNCPGDETYCAGHCPIQVQYQCDFCEGNGQVAAARAEVYRDITESTEEPR